MSYVEKICYKLLPFILENQWVDHKEIHGIKIVYMEMVLFRIKDIKMCNISIKYANQIISTYKTHRYIKCSDTPADYYFKSDNCVNLAECYSHIIKYLKLVAKTTKSKERDCDAIKYVERYIAGDMKRRYTGFHDISIKTK
jgi:hypothetical protein